MTIRQALTVLREPEQVVEVRILGTPNGIVSGYFDDPARLDTEVQRYDGKAKGIYVTLNPVDPALLARAANRLRPLTRDDQTTVDHEIVKRRWLLIDLDPIRPAGISSSDDEKDLARQRLEVVQTHLTNQGWPQAVVGDSGNGWHLLYRIELPNDDSALRLIKKCLLSLDVQFSDNQVAVDTVVSNAARITKLYGTTTKKGDVTPARPHRRSAMVSVPNPLVPVLPDKLTALAQHAPDESSAPDDHSDLANWLADKKILIASEGPWRQSGYKWVLEQCPWDASHTNKSAYIVRFANGAVAAGCHHHGCANKNWPELRALFQPVPPANHETDEHPSVLRKVERLNLRFAILAVGNTVVVADFRADRSIAELWPFPEFKRFLIKERVEVLTDKGMKKVPLADIWLRHRKGRRYEKLVYAMPGSAAMLGPHDYNGWHGFTVEPGRGDWSKNRAHVLDIICSGNQEHFAWLWNWNAALVQQPGKHAWAAPVLRGGQGTGKGHYVDKMLGGLFHPQQYLHLLGANQLTAEFNEHLSGKVLVYR